MSWEIKVLFNSSGRASRFGSLRSRNPADGQGAEALHDAPDVIIPVVLALHDDDHFRQLPEAPAPGRAAAETRPQADGSPSGRKTSGSTSRASSHRPQKVYAIA